MTKDGRLTAMDIEGMLDGGAYVHALPRSSFAQEWYQSTGPYRCPDVRIRGRVTMTNTLPDGAAAQVWRTQTLLSAEVHIERIAEALGMQRSGFGEVNAFRPGDTTATGQKLGKDSLLLPIPLREAGPGGPTFRRRRRALAGSKN